MGLTGFWIFQQHLTYKNMGNIIQNVNPKRNPVTSVLGCVFVVISGGMYIIKYMVPAFFMLKQEIPFDWYTPILPLLIGLVLIFINDDYFARIFNRADKVVGKKTDTE